MKMLESLQTIENLYSTIKNLTEQLMVDPSEEIIMSVIAHRGALLDNISVEEFRLRSDFDNIPKDKKQRIAEIIQSVILMDKEIVIEIGNRMNSISTELRSLYSTRGAAKAYLSNSRF